MEFEITRVDCIFQFLLTNTMTATYEMVELKDAGGNKLNGIMRCKGQLIPTFERPREIAEDMVDLVDMPIRDDDIMFCSAVKSGICTLFS